MICCSNKFRGILFFCFLFLIACHKEDLPPIPFFMDPRDGQVYNTVKFRNQWVMSENLRYGTWIQDSMMPSQNLDHPVFI